MDPGSIFYGGPCIFYGTYRIRNPIEYGPGSNLWTPIDYGSAVQILCGFIFYNRIWTRRVYIL